MRRRAEPYFDLIERALDRLDAYRPAERDTFLNQRVLQDAILLQLLQVGENLKQLRDLDEDLFLNAPKSWHQSVGLRNTIARGYQRIRADLIWQYLEEDLEDFRRSATAARVEGWYDTPTD